MRRILIYGGCGALGSVCVNFFKNKGFWICSVDFKENQVAERNVVLKKSDSAEEQHTSLHEILTSYLNAQKLDAIFCVAGGWVGGNAAHKDFIRNTDIAWKQSVLPSCITASVASKHLASNGIVVLMGAEAAVSPTPNMLAYGMAKAAVHQLVRSLAAKSSGLPSEAVVTGILPVVLDTPMNRKWMPKADHTTWTPLEAIAENLSNWLDGCNCPPSGSLLKVVTNGGMTDFIPV